MFGDFPARDQVEDLAPLGGEPSRGVQRMRTGRTLSRAVDDDMIGIFLHF